RRERGPPVIAADNVAGLPRRRRGRRHTRTGQDVPRHGPEPAAHQAHPRTEPDPPAGDRSTAGPPGTPRRRGAGANRRRGVRHGGTARGWRTPRPGPVRPPPRRTPRTHLVIATR